MNNLAKPTESQAKTLLSLAPNKLLDKHRNLAKMQESAMWGSGELSVELQELYFPEYSKASIRKAVGEIYSIAINTVRDRERVAAAVPEDLRTSMPYLKFHHWRNILPAGQKKADQMLWESAAMFEAEGKGPSVDQILAWRGNDKMDATLPWIYRLQNGMEKLEMIRDDPMTDSQIRVICGNTIRYIGIRSAEIKLDRFQLKDGKDERT